MGGIDRRLKDLEARTPPNPCPACGGWFAIVLNGKLDALSRHGTPADEYQRAEYLEYGQEAERNGGKCPACGAAPLEIKVGGLSEAV